MIVSFYSFARYQSNFNARLTPHQLSTNSFDAPPSLALLTSLHLPTYTIYNIANMSLSKALKVALIQFTVTADKAANLTTVRKRVTEAASAGAKMVVLPECFNSPYAVTAFPKYAETIPSGETTQFLSKLAKDSGVFLIGGSIPESRDGKYFNTNVDFSPTGEIIGKHSKVHLFDIDVPGKIRFMESDVLTGGSAATVVDLPGYGKAGVGICYDVRFPELALAATSKGGAFAMIYPGAFNTTTGPLHWQLLARARAVDNQVYVILCSPSRDMTSSYHAYGHSLVVDPWGKVLAEAGEGDEIVYATLEPEPLDSVRASIPVLTQRRFDIYPDVAANAKLSNK